jgi:sphinganine C4-monooxygenase
MFNSSIAYDVPPLPSYTLMPLPALIPAIPDKILVMILPFIAYWVVSLIFHWIDTKDLFPQYRLHTPAEILARNHATRWEVFRDVLKQQIVQTVFGIGMGMVEPDELTGKEEYDVAVWSRRIRIAQRSIPTLMSMVGLDSLGLARNMADSHPMVAGFLSGGNYTTVTQLVSLPEYPEAAVPAFARWETLVASGIYYFLIPFLQLAFGILFVDTWQYFLHRGMHSNKWLYSKISPLYLRFKSNRTSQSALHPPPPLCPLCLRRPLQYSHRRLLA